jgi:peroxiredoxin
MVDVGDRAPDFTAPIVDGGDPEPFTLSDALGDGPVVLAFFPGAFTDPCTDEMCSFRDSMAEYEDVGATVYGVSVDTPFALAEWADRNDLSFGLVSDTNKEIIDDYGVSIDFADMGYYGVAQRAVFVVDGSGEITYKWVADEPPQQPDFDAVQRAAEAAA